MPAEISVHDLVGGGPVALVRTADRSGTPVSPTVLVAAALVAEDGEALLSRAAAGAVTTRDRQLVALAAAHLGGDADRFDALVRDHLADHPDSVLAAWLATRHAAATTPTSEETHHA